MIDRTLPPAGVPAPVTPAVSTRPSVARPTTPSDKEPPAAIARTAQEFEAVFLGEMSKLMLESVDMGDQFSGGHAEQMFRGVLAEKLGAEIALRGGVGLAPSVMEQMIRMQEGSQ